jgi:hypothetical protein
MQEEPNRPAAYPQPGAASADGVSLGIFQRKGAKKSRDFLGKGNPEVTAKCILSRLEQMPEIVFRNGRCARGLEGAYASRVWCSASRRTHFSGGTPEGARGDACAPQTLATPALLKLFQPATQTVPKFVLYRTEICPSSQNRRAPLRFRNQVRRNSPHRSGDDTGRPHWERES